MDLGLLPRTMQTIILFIQIAAKYPVSRPDDGVDDNNTAAGEAAAVDDV